MYLKSKFLSSVRPFFAPDDEGKKTASELAAEERAKIKIGDTTSKDDDKDDDKKDDDKDDTVDGESKESDKVDESEEDEEGESKEGDDDKDDKEEPKELSADQKAIKKLERTVERLQKRVGKTTAEKTAITNELKEAKKALEAKVGDGEQPLDEAEVNRRAREIADQTVTQNEFDRMQSNLIDAGKKIDKTFMTKINNLAEEVAPLPGLMIPALSELDHGNGGAVLNYLTDNPDEYEDILQLKSPTKIINKLIKISDKLADEGKPKPKKISQVPDPAKKDIGGNASRNNDTLPADPTKNMKDWVRIRNKQAEQYRKEKLGL